MARRNEALIEAPPAATFPEIPPSTPEGLAGMGEAVQVAADLVPVEPLPPAERDDLKRIKGVGPKVETILHGLGVTTFAQATDASQTFATNSAHHKLSHSPPRQHRT